MQIITKNRSRLLLVVCVMIQTLVMYSQPRTNPFEVRQRLSTIVNVDTNSVLGALVDSTAAQASTNVQLPASDTSILKPVVGSSNPFEVDHVPIRKSQFDKRKEKLVTSISSTKSSDGFLSWFLFLACGLLAIVINTQSKTLTFIPQSLYNENILKLTHREESGKSSAFFIFLYTIFLINLSAALYLISGHYGGQKGINIFLYFLGGVFVVYLIRHAFLSVLGNLFDISKNTNLYSFTVMIFNAFMGLCLIPLNFIMAYSPENIKGPTVIFTIVLISLIVLMRLLRGLLIASDFIFSRLLQFIVYLCGFEIAPVLIGIKFLMNNMTGS
jgi:hypothetical protein